LYYYQESLLYKLHSHEMDPRANVRSEYFQEVYKSKYEKVRIFKIMDVDQESKTWVSINKKCDEAGGWICPGSYPPKLMSYISKDSGSRTFEAPVRSSVSKESGKSKENAVHDVVKKNARPSSFKQEDVKAHRNAWEDTEYTVRMWNIINSGTPYDLERALEEYPSMAFMRSSDGRSAMHWAFENRQEEMVEILKRYGVGYDDVDKYGLTPVDLLDTTLHY
jgi:dolichyl-diphosphooligosaccharide---protein glycosyltransferase